MKDKIKKAISVLEVNKLISSSQTEFCESVDIAIKALEEISLYKQNGLCLIPSDVYKKQCEELDNYKELGTVEELRFARDNQIPKKPILIKRSFTKFLVCPMCSNAEHYQGIYSKIPYCYQCGQKLDWSVEDENNG